MGSNEKDAKATEKTHAFPRFQSLDSLPRPKLARRFSSLPSSPIKRKSLKLSDDEGDSFAPFDVLSVDPDDRTLWWKVPDVKLDDFYDWQLKVHRVDDFTLDLIGILKTSPYFDRISEQHRQQMHKFLNAGPEVFNSIGEHFDARMNNRSKQKRLIITLNATQIGLFRYGKRMCAILNVCPHQQAPLAMGDIEEVDGRLCISCPRHHWCFDLADGKLRQPFFRTDGPSATMFPVKIVGNQISIGFSQYNPTIFGDVDF